MTVIKTIQRPSLLQWIYLLAPPLLILLALVSVGLKPQALQFFALYLPGVWLLWRSLVRPQKFWLVAAHLWAFMFSLDVLVRITLWINYSSLPDSSFILLAISNSNPQESGEYLSHNNYFLHTLPLLFVINIWIQLLHKKITPQALPRTLGSSLFIAFLILLLITAYSLRPTRKLAPFIYWPNYLTTIQHFQTDLKNGPHVIAQWEAAAKKSYTGYTGPEQQTLVLALGESTTRLDMQLCGYKRATTPTLLAMRAELAVFCNGYSGASSTVSSLKLMLTNETLATPDTWDKDTSLLALARAAGFKIFWLSNQDDLFTANMFGAYADKSAFLNRQSGRASVSLDENLLSDYTLALNDPHPKKLIVVHLIGNHPNYTARYTDEIFSAGADDAVNQEMQANDRNLWIRTQRAAYDNAVLYQDKIIAQLINNLRTQTTGTQHFIYASDHGNEVGHVRNFAGHSPTTEAGYAVPVIYWGTAQTLLNNYEGRQFVTDNLDQSLLNLLQIHSNNYQPERDIFSDAYQWQQPKQWPLWAK